MAKRKKLVLIDGNALIHRAYHAFAQARLTNTQGHPTGAIYGYALMLLNIFAKLKPEYIAVAFDTGKPTFRHEEYGEYKATRKAADQELIDQIPHIHELTNIFNIPVFAKEGFEADDIIGTLATQAPKDIDVYIATGDMDALQLVDNNIFVYAPKKGFADIMIYDKKTVLEQKGLKPDQMIDFKGLRGDPSDNIPGVKGIGEIGAKKLLLEFGTIENIYEHLQGIPERTRQLLDHNKSMAFQSKRLATILTNIPIKLDLKKAVAEEFDASKVREFFHKYGFRSLLSKIPNGTLTDTAQNQTSFFDSAPEMQATAKKGRLTSAEKLDQALEPILEKMSAAGILVDVSFLQKMSEQVGKDIEKLEKKILKEADTDFNIASPIQLSEILFDKLNLPTLNIKRTKSGYSTGAGELEKLIDLHPIVRLILDYRGLSKLKNTYLDTLPNMVDENNRIHTTYLQETSTGRLSSRDPNLQNIPIRTELGAEIRKAFIAPKGFKLLKADYSQIELRIVASLAKDKKMMETFINGEDIHTRTAAEMTGKKPEDVTKAERRDAKTVNFSILYGVSPYGLAARTDMTVPQAKEYIDKYFEVYSGVKKYMKDIVAFALTHGYVETLLGRRREISDINSNIFPVRSAAQRAAINMPIQGTAADMIKTAMIEIDKKLPQISPKSQMLLQVHDELVFEVPDKDIEKVGKFVTTIMGTVYKLDVPVEVHIDWGKSWEGK
ncbi:MAG: DNA polymerase I [Patescibacteria group bacterium]|nr:DNA polymerase I [Patescibacteria group bacterium]